MELLWQSAAVVLVLGLVMLAGWAAKRGTTGAFAFRRILGAAPAASQMKVVERIVLTPQHTLHRVRMEERDLLLVTHPQGCVVVQETPRSGGAAA